jgi:biotin-(acetyl-CoA carboxylase) ligase
MRKHIARFAATLVVLGIVTVASAQVAVESGTVVRIDPQSSVVMLDDGRIYRVTPSTVFLIDNRPVAFPTLRPGERVVIHSAEPVTYRDGRYISLGAPPVVAQAPPPVVAAPPAVVVPSGLRQTIYGRVEDVDRDGRVKIRTDGDDFEARISQQAARQLKKGDTVTIDMTFTAPGAPAASPR